MIRRRSLVACAALTSLASRAAEVELSNFRFGIIQEVSDKVFEFVEQTTRIPRRYKDTGFRFGVGFDNPRCLSIEWYEVVHLPADLKEVSGNFQRTRKRTMRTRTQSSDQATVVDDFWFDEGDPLGAHRLDLYVNGSLRYTVSFDVVSDR